MDSVCIGDLVTLYCEETDGYVTNCQSSSHHNVLFAYHGQDRDKAINIPCQAAITFEVCVRNRYKLNKVYRKVQAQVEKKPKDVDLQIQLSEAKASADAEGLDNVAEQKRQHGRQLRYGQIIQLRHVFTGKFIHVSTTKTSQRDKNSMMVSLESYNSKHAQYKILPRFKVKSEGDIVQANDQVILESMKSVSHFLHTSSPYAVDNFNKGCEVNLGVHKTGFSIRPFRRPNEENMNYVCGGSMIRFFHKEIEAYLTAEGVFDDRLTENVHMRIRAMDPSRPKSVFPSTSANTYWQLCPEESFVNGDVVKWNQQVRLRHMPTRHYLCVDSDGKLTMTETGDGPTTVFRLQPVIQSQDEVEFETYCRLQHASGKWIHARKDDEYVKSEVLDAPSGGTKALRWDGAPCRKVTTTTDLQYDDAFTIQRVNEKDEYNFNFAAGMVPAILNLILDTTGQKLNRKATFQYLQAMQELKAFMLVNGVPSKDRQKLLRNLKIVDLLVKYLKTNLMNVDFKDLVEKLHIEALAILETYLLGDSRKNELYFSKHIDYFNSQFAVQGEIGFRATTMITELIRDNRKIVDRTSKSDIDQIVELVRQTKNHRYLDLLEVLCVCDGVAIPDHQTYITQKWLVQDKRGVFLTELGNRINKSAGVVYVTKDHGATWIALHKFCSAVKNSVDANAVEEYKFLESQLNLFGRLCYQRNAYAINVITKELGYLTWEEAFTCIREELLPDDLRAKYTAVILDLFVDVEGNRSLLDQMNLSFVYNNVDKRVSKSETLKQTKKSFKKSKKRRGEDKGGLTSLIVTQNQDNLIGASRDPGIHSRKFRFIQSIYLPPETLAIFPQLSDWIARFLDDNKDMTASEIGHNMLVEQVLRLVHALVTFGYYGDASEVKKLLKPLLNLLDGRNDKPVPHQKGFKESDNEHLIQYQRVDRFKPCPETKAVVDAKYRAMEVVDLLMNMQFNERLQKFISQFKKLGSKLQKMTGRDAHQVDSSTKSKFLSDVESIMHKTAFFNDKDITDILMDICNYEYDKMVNKAWYLLNRVYSANAHLYQKAVQAQVLITEESVNRRKQLSEKIPILKQLSKAKFGDEDAEVICSIMTSFKKMCHLPGEPDERHPINQTILVNHGILEIIVDLLSTQIIDTELLNQYSSMQEVLSTTLGCLQYLSKGNAHVQQYIFSRLDVLLETRGVETSMALALTEVFTGNQETCMKIRPGQIKKIVDLAAEQQEKAPELLDLLCAIVKVEELNLPLKRNQGYVMKMVMEKYQKICYPMERSREERNSILKGNEGAQHLSYLISMVDLFATCAEGENQFIESLCQTVTPVDELIAVLNDNSVDNNLKRPYVRYLLWAYLNTAGSLVESGILDLPTRILKWLKDVTLHIHMLTTYVQNNKQTTSLLLKKAPPKSGTDNTQDGQAYGTLHFLFDAALPFFEVFYRKGFTFDTAEMQEVTNNLTKVLMAFSDVTRPLICDKNQMQTLNQSLISCMTQSSNVPDEMVRSILTNSGTGELKTILSEAQSGYYSYYSGEQVLNNQFNEFSIMMHIFYQGENTVKYQLGGSSCREYTRVGGNEELPLGKEFQNFVDCLLPDRDGALQQNLGKAKLVVKQLEISATRLSSLESSSPQQVEVDVKCLQLLRALIHNEEIRLPENWEDNLDKHKVQLDSIKTVQGTLNDFGGILNTLPLIERRQDDVVREYLAFVSTMLINANTVSQKSLEKYFLNTREELFFTAVQRRMNLSKIATKERRYLAAQFAARQEEEKTRTATLLATLGGNKTTAQAIQREEEHMKKEEMEKGGVYAPEQVRMAAMELRALHQDGLKKKAMDKKNKKAQPNGYTNQGYGADTEEKASPLESLKQKDEGYIELVLKTLAGMCDGQNKVLQDYLREQPDNIMSINLIAETTSFLSLLYTQISSTNIELVTQLFDTLNEFASGNIENHHVMYDNNIVDYINFILRTGRFDNIDEVKLADEIKRKVLEMRNVIGKLLMSIIEENHATGAGLLKEIRETLDFENILRVALQCYEHHGMREHAQDLKDEYLNTGFLYYYILERLDDITEEKILEGMCKTREHKDVIKFYKTNSRSIEVMKDGEIHRIRFRVKDHKILREEVKEEMKWNVDRSSPSNKIRALMEWSKDIIDDIYYQRKVRSFIVTDRFIRHWNLWNNLCILLSLAINIVMLVTWKANNVTTVDANNTTSTSFLSKPVYDDWYRLVNMVIGIIHNVFASFVLATYFISSRPMLPDIQGFFSSKLGKDQYKPKHKSRLREDLLGFRTMYYIAFLVFSICGTIWYGYFFAFHLLNITYNNQLLQRVIKAITLNGKSLLWVTVLGIVIIYIFALAAFAVFRGNMEQDMQSDSVEQYLYCGTLWQCTITMLRYGLVGELFEFMKPGQNVVTFASFGKQAVFTLFFFVIITTIGLNIIFGIILDTFSELRSNKMETENDMRSCCFICGRDSYEFETHSTGFDYHVKEEHNMWAYIFFLIHLNGTKYNDYSTLELYVYHLVKNGTFDFFPVGRAMSLANIDEDTTEQKLDELSLKVDRLVAKQQQDQHEKLKILEEEKQRKWEAAHRHELGMDSGN